MANDYIIRGCDAALNGVTAEIESGLWFGLGMRDAIIRDEEKTFKSNASKALQAIGMGKAQRSRTLKLAKTVADNADARFGKEMATGYNHEANRVSAMVAVLKASCKGPTGRLSQVRVLDWLATGDADATAKADAAKKIEVERKRAEAEAELAAELAAGLDALTDPEPETDAGSKLEPTPEPEAVSETVADAVADMVARFGFEAVRDALLAQEAEAVRAAG